MNCQQCGKRDRVLSLASDGRMLCDVCRQRQQRALTRLAAAVSRGKTIAVDVGWSHQADRRALGRKLTRIAATTPDDARRILTSIAAALRTSNPILTVDLTSVSPAAARIVDTTLGHVLDREITASGPLRDLTLTITAAWTEWTRHQ